MKTGGIVRAMNVRAIRTRVFKEHESIVEFVEQYVTRPKEGSVVVVTSKIVALSEGRTAAVAAKEAIVRNESEFAMPTKYAWLTIKDGAVMATAGIDESNAAGKLILLPKDSFAAAARIRTALKKKYGLKRLGVLITDSRVLPLRSGVTGVATGYAGFKGVRDYRGSPDIFGRKLAMTQVNVADALATAAVLLMGEGSEQRPLAIISDVDIDFRERTDRNELRIHIEDDLYKPLFDTLKP